MREKTALVCSGGKHRNPEERKGEKTGLSFAFLFLSSPSLVFLSSFSFNEKRERERRRKRAKGREGEREKALLSLGSVEILLCLSSCPSSLLLLAVLGSLWFRATDEFFERTGSLWRGTESAMFFFPLFATPRGGRLRQWLRLWERRKSKAKARESCPGKTTFKGFLRVKTHPKSPEQERLGKHGSAGVVVSKLVPSHPRPLAKSPPLLSTFLSHPSHSPCH